MQANLGNVSAAHFLFGFNEPYVRNRPLNVGFQIFNNKHDYNAAKNYKLAGGNPENLSTAQQSLLQNYNQSSTGFNVSASYPIHRSFKRVGFTYTFNKSVRHDLQRRIAQLLPDPRLPQRHSGSERAERHRQQSGFLQFHHEQAGRRIPAAHGYGVFRRHCRSPASGATYATSARSSNTAVSIPSRASSLILKDVTYSATACRLLISRASAAMSRRHSIASTPAARPICAASMSARSLPTVSCPRACSSTSPIPTAAPCRAIPPIRRSVLFRFRFPVYGIASIGGDTNVHGKRRIPYSHLRAHGQLRRFR